MKRPVFFILLVITLGMSCSDSAVPEPALYFRGGMDSVTISNNSGLLQFNGWNSLKNIAYVDNFEFNNVGGTDYAYQEIVANPVKSTEKVMHAVVLNDDPNVSATTRAQLALNFKDGVTLDAYHTSLRILLDQDVDYLKNYPGSISWFVLFEAWNKKVDAWDGDGAGSARWNLNVYKETGSTDFYWAAEAETMQPASAEQAPIWSYNNKTAAVPINKWFTLDVYLKRGEGPDGRFIIKITPDGEKTVVLFDIKGTTIYPGHPEIQLNAWQPFKFYFNDLYLDWMKSQNKTLSCYYDDFKWYKK